MNAPWPQHGIGIELRGGAFRAVYLRRQWKQLRVVDVLEIPQYAQTGPAERGRMYRQFLRKHGLKVPWTVVALPRSAVLLRALNLPRAINQQELARAVEYQLDSLHPFEEASIAWDVALWRSPEKRLWPGVTASGGALQFGKAAQVGESGVLHALVAIAQQQSVEELASWFQEAGIPVSQFGVGAALLLGTLAPRLDATGSSRSSLFLLDWGAEGLQLVAYAPGREVIWREMPVPEEGPENDGELPASVQHELELARAELRVDPAARPPLVVCGARAPLRLQEAEFRAIPLEQLFPTLRGTPGFAPQEHPVLFAAALAAAEPDLPLNLNLLPAEQRSFQSPLVNVPTYALAALVVILGIALGVRGTLQDWLYSRYLDREIQALRPQVQQIENAQGQGQKTLARLALLAQARNSMRLPLEVLNELTRLLPADVWLQQLRYDGTVLFLNGYASSASGLLQTLAASPYFENPQFAGGISRQQEGKELFQINVRLRQGVQ